MEEATTEGNKKKKEKKPWEPWEKSRCKQWLKKWFKDGSIPAEYSKPIGPGPRAVYDAICANHADFGGAGMKYDDNFTRRLGAEKAQFLKKQRRADLDQKCFDNYRQHHPEKETNHRGEPRWEGSLAQAQLKKDVEEKYQVGKKPKELWEDNGENRESYRDYPLQVFRDHIYQEIRLRKWINFTIQERREKGLVLDDEDAEEESVVVRDDGIEVDYDGIAVVDGNDNLLDGDPPN